LIPPNIKIPALVRAAHKPSKPRAQQKPKPSPSPARQRTCSSHTGQSMGTSVTMKGLVLLSTTSGIAIWIG